MYSTIFHPTDFSNESFTAFVHALKLASESRASFDIMHTESNDYDDGQFPAVRETLIKWGMIDEDTEQNELTAKTGIKVRKVVFEPTDILSAVERWLKRHPADLIVLATHGRDGLQRWMQGSIAEEIVRNAATPTLLLSHDSFGFVDNDSGATTLKNILLPVAQNPQPFAAIQATESIMHLCNAEEATVHLLYVGDDKDRPNLDNKLESFSNLQWHNRTGNIVQGITEVAEDVIADLIVMTTEGHNGFLDVFRGSTTERVVSDAGFPVLAVPVLN